MSNIDLPTVIDDDRRSVTAQITELALEAHVDSVPAFNHTHRLLLRIDIRNPRSDPVPTNASGFSCRAVHVIQLLPISRLLITNAHLKNFEPVLLHHQRLSDLVRLHQLAAKSTVGTLR